MFDELDGWMVGKVSLSLEKRPGWMLPGGQTTGDWRGSQAPGVEIPPAIILNHFLLIYLCTQSLLELIYQTNVCIISIKTLPLCLSTGAY